MVSKEQMEQRLIRANPVGTPEHLHQDPAEADALLALILERREDMTMTKQPLPTRPPTRPWWHSARIAAAAAVLVVLVVGVAALIGFGGEDPDTADQVTTVPPVESTVPVTEPSATPTTAAPEATLPAPTTVPPQQSLLDGTWTHETSTEPFPRFEVIETSIGYFSRGNNIEGREGGPGVWFSPDGGEWLQVLSMPVGEIIEDAELLPGEPPIYTIEASVHSVVEFDGAVYAFATIADPAHGPGRAVEQIAYRTTDGVEFEALVYSTESGNPKAVVVGDGEMLVIMSPSDPRTSVLRSEDGVNWTRHEPPFVIHAYDDAVAFISGRYLAVGEFAESDAYPWGRRTMVETLDGIEWTVLAGGEFAYNDFPRFLTEHEDMFYMGGLYFDEATGGEQTGMVFFSEDGEVWQRATMPAIDDLRFVTDLIPTEYGLLAVGWAGWSENPARVVPMTTLDGTTFVEVPTAEGLFAQGEAYHGYREGSGVALFGNDFDPILFHKWTWTPDS